jgi:hypothetical protein
MAPMADTSSIGPQWPPRETSHGRVKGIDNRGIVRDRERLAELLGVLEAFAGGFRESGADRISIRALVADSLIEAERAALEPFGEAIVPLESGGELEGCSLLYLGWNGAERQSAADDVERALSNIVTAVERSRRRPAEIRERVERQGFALSIPTMDERRGDDRLGEDVAGLYRRFGWSAEDTRQILEHEESLIAVAREGEGDEARVVSAGIAELSRIDLGDGASLRIAEFTEAATLKTHQGRGLYSAICATLMLELTRLSRRGEVEGGEIDVAFGESSGHDLGVLIAAIRLGRTFSRQVVGERNLPFPGYLPQHVPIAGAPRSTRYNDLFPTFLSRRGLYAFADS